MIRTIMICAIKVQGDAVVLMTEMNSDLVDEHGVVMKIMVMLALMPVRRRRTFPCVFRAQAFLCAMLALFTEVGCSVGMKD